MARFYTNRATDIPTLDKAKEFLSKHPEYRTTGFKEFKYDSGDTVITADVYKKGSKRVARLEYDKAGKPTNRHGQAYSEIDWGK